MDRINDILDQISCDNQLKAVVDKSEPMRTPETVTERLNFSNDRFTEIATKLANIRVNLIQ